MDKPPYLKIHAVLMPNKKGPSCRKWALFRPVIVFQRCKDKGYFSIKPKLFSLLPPKKPNNYRPLRSTAPPTWHYSSIGGKCVSSPSSICVLVSCARISKRRRFLRSGRNSRQIFGLRSICFSIVGRRASLFFFCQDDSRHNDGG